MEIIEGKYWIKIIPEDTDDLLPILRSYRPNKEENMNAFTDKLARPTIDQTIAKPQIPAEETFQDKEFSDVPAGN